ncbi:hypothetical protein D9V37_18045 [Nocardioides mangrovicus]|uniref:Uncharacterized protein n=1 Tax=Nocardioides mangrovicus TaxID=2478913 RepID=A0A3L8NZM2_9ACTN|nr:hypothetical protein [Nocardioides mangrovicus]RLV48003.1 hypothetical protein D9V37_18045 [Nocardioides mangrovicus]
MSTAVFSTEPLASRLLAPVRDLQALLAFRASGLDRRRRHRLQLALGIVVGLTLSAIVVPAYVRGSAHEAGVGKILGILPSIYLGFLVLAAVSAAASGGGRELVPRDQAVAWPISPTTDHLGSLLLAPLNVAWLLQAWTLLGMTSYSAGPKGLLLTVLPVLAYIGLATALGQVVAWTLEWVRRGPSGTWIVRGIVLAVAALVAGVLVTGHLTEVLDHSPTLRVYLAALNGQSPGLHTYVVPTLTTALLAAAAVVVGALPAGWAARRAPREEHRLETGLFRPRPNPASDLWALVRIDRAGVWRSVPLRRGLLVLAVMPGAIALAGHLQWTRLTILPGLVASGAALLFGVNTWCLDGRGGLWRQSLPVAPGQMFTARVWVLAEVLLATALLTVTLGATRAGRPTPEQLLSVVAVLVVVTGQVLSASMRWSVDHPYAVDMRSARATPAPPVVMVGYSTRLALSTTVVGLVFSGLAEVADGTTLILQVAAFLLLISVFRIYRARSRWLDPAVRAKIVVTIAG